MQPEQLSMPQPPMPRPSTPQPAHLRWISFSSAGLMVFTACLQFRSDVGPGNPWWTSRGVCGLLFATNLALVAWQPRPEPKWRRNSLATVQMVLAIGAVLWMFVREHFRVHAG